MIASFSYKGIGCPVACPLVFISGIHTFCGYGLTLLFNVFEIVWVKLSRIYLTDMFSVVWAWSEVSVPAFWETSFFLELKMNITHYFLNVPTDPIILSVHFTNRMWCFEYASNFSSLYNVLFSAAKACQGDLCGWLICSGVYSSTMRIYKTGELGGMSYI